MYWAGLLVGSKGHIIMMLSPIAKFLAVFGVRKTCVFETELIEVGVNIGAKLVDPTVAEFVFFGLAVTLLVAILALVTVAW